MPKSEKEIRLEELQDAAKIAREAFGAKPTPDEIAAVRGFVFSWEKKSEREEAKANLVKSVLSVRRAWPASCQPGDDDCTASLAIEWYGRVYEHDKAAARSAAEAQMAECCELAKSGVVVEVPDPDDLPETAFMIFDTWSEE